MMPHDPPKNNSGSVKVKVIFIIPYPLGEAPSQRFRFEQYLPDLKARGYDIRTLSFLDLRGWQTIYKSGHLFAKGLVVFRGFLKRIIHTFLSTGADYVFIHREATPIGPPVFEWLIAKVLRKKIVYDFDDAIWLPDENPQSRLTDWLKCRSKIASIIRWSYRISCGNRFLLDYAARYNNSVVLMPTTIDTEHVHDPNRFPSRVNRSSVIIGWTGSHSTLKYLSIIEPALKELLLEFPQVSLTIICNRKPELTLPFTFSLWKIETEIRDLVNFDIGIMPLSADPWAEGKCGFKALQYMALTIPPVVSPVGVNRQIVSDGIDGFHADNQEQWFQALKTLIIDDRRRREMGVRARNKVILNYSVSVNRSVFLSLFE